MISLVKPTIPNYVDKTPLPIGGGINYNLLPSDKRFEELLYTIYKQKIENDETWNTLFDDIYLTAASGDSGADCILYKDGKAKGVIQCKKYAKNIDKTEVSKEILKFLLYTIVDNGLMPDAENFHYYFSVSKGFSKTAIELIENFNEEILKGEKIEIWFNELKKKYSATLGQLEYHNIQSELYGKLKSIKIKKISPPDLDIELNKPYNFNIQQIFFIIKTVTDNSLLDEGISRILEKINDIPKELLNIDLTEAQILQKFETASLQLKEWKSMLADIEDSHIQRNETQQILNWVSNKLPKEKEPILMLAGNPGFGKSVILKDVLIELIRDNVPVIGIKADRYYAESIEKFNEFTNLKYPLESLIEILLKKYDKVVVLIDQIDSLSTSVTSKRIYLDIYRQLIDNILSIVKDKPPFLKNKVRLVIAIRDFDLIYNFEFSYFRKFEKIAVEKISETQLQIILEKLNLKLASLSTHLIDLIRIPAYLEIFCKICKPGTNLNRINTAMDLMDELWNQETNISDEFSPLQISSVLYTIANKLYELNQLSLDVKKLPALNTRLMVFLRSRGLILGSQNQIQFFHQTFYDYVFARSFVEKKKSLQEYILTENQSIYIRPTLKIMIAFYRQTNFKKYISLIDKILFSNKYRFHIQLLIIQEIGFLPDPRPEEVSLVTKKLLKRELFFLPFLESAFGENWFEILRTNKIVDKLIFYQPPKEKFFKIISFFLSNRSQIEKTAPEQYSALWSSVIRKAFLNKNRKSALDYLFKLKRFENDSNKVLWIMLGLKKWDYSVAIDVFEKYIGDIKDDWYTRLSLIEDAVDYNYDWSLKQLRIVLEHEPDNTHNQNSMYEYHICNILDKLSKNDKERFFEFGIEIVVQNISKKLQHIANDKEEEFYLYDPVYGSFNLSKDYRDDEDNKLLKLLFDDARELSKTNSVVFTDFITQFNNTKYITLQIILCSCYIDNPEKYKDYSFKIIKNFLLHAPENAALDSYIFQLLNVSFVFFSEDEKNELIDIILKCKSKYPEYYTDKVNGKKVLRSHFGRLKFDYLSSIPYDEIHKRPVVRRQFQELQRKYKAPEKKSSDGTILRGAGPPLADKAYKYLDLEAWEKTMLKYDKYYKDNRFNGFRGGIVEHSREFAKVVENRPEYFLPLLKKIVTVTNVDDEYIIEGLSGLEKAKFDPETFLTLYKLAINKITSDYGMMRLMWLTNYVHQNQLIDDEVFNFLCFQAVHHKNPLKILNEGDPIHEAFNSVRGAAISEVVKCYYKKEFTEKIFETVKILSKDPIVSVRLSALNYMAYLMYLDKEKTLEVFLAYTTGDIEDEIYKYSVNTAQYLARYNFKALMPYFNNILNCESEIENISVVLAVAWLNDKPGSYELLKRSWEKSDKAKAKTVDVAIKNYIEVDEATKEKCFQLFCMFLENDVSEIVHEYSVAFLSDMLPVNFEEYYPLIKKYSTSKVAIKDPHYYFDYLTMCSKQHPEKCIDLIESYKKYDKPNILTGPHYDGSEPVKIVVGALNGLYETENKNIVYITKAMNLFDEMLKSSIYRGSAFDVLSKI
ncbi:MAG: hypothetical protein JWO92_1134 [Chitinophagaceae bacterium]|nr:hypothetical protein [Chitinophagaceae bacterium]